MNVISRVAGGSLGLGSFFVAVACGQPAGPTSPQIDVTAGEPSTVPTGRAETSGLEPGACAKDGDCQLAPTCDCQRCVASIAMHVDPCAEPCSTNACSGHVAACVRGRCEDRPPAEASGGHIACKRDADCPTLPCGPCTSGTPIDKKLVTEECVVNPCKRPGSRCGASHICETFAATE